MRKERRKNQKTTTEYICPYCSKKRIFLFCDRKEDNSEVVVCKSCEHQYTIQYLKDYLILVILLV